MTSNTDRGLSADKEKMKGVTADSGKKSSKIVRSRVSQSKQFTEWTDKDMSGDRKIKAYNKPDKRSSGQAKIFRNNLENKTKA